jgi:hypothetical protein
LLILDREGKLVVLLFGRHLLSLCDEPVDPSLVLALLVDFRAAKNGPWGQLLLAKPRSL